MFSLSCEAHQIQLFSGRPKHPLMPSSLPEANFFVCLYISPANARLLYKLFTPPVPAYSPSARDEARTNVLHSSSTFSAEKCCLFFAVRKVGHSVDQNRNGSSPFQIRQHCICAKSLSIRPPCHGIG